jgi:probable phosphoglycerate mutase
MELTLIRHGEPEWVRDGLSVDDPPLTGRGHEQARRLADALANEHFDEVLVSPLVRARQTAAPLLERLGRSEVIAPWLEEIRNPVWHGTPAEKAEEAYREQRERPPHQHWSGLDGGEPVDSFQERIRLGASLFLAEHGVERIDEELPIWKLAEPGRRIALVAHAGTNSVTLCHVLGLPATPWEWERFVLHHASRTRVEAIAVGGAHTFALSRLSDVEHLHTQDRTR